MRVDGLFEGCSSNASVDELAEYFCCQCQRAARGGEPKIHYMVWEMVEWVVVVVFPFVVIHTEKGEGDYQGKKGGLLQ